MKRIFFYQNMYKYLHLVREHFLSKMTYKFYRAGITVDKWCKQERTCCLSALHVVKQWHKIVIERNMTYLFFIIGLLQNEPGWIFGSPFTNMDKL